MYAETIKPPATSDNSLTPALNYYGTETRVAFTGNCLKQTKSSYAHGKVVNIYIVYELGASGSNDSAPTLKNCFLVQLLWQKMLILKSMGILIIKLDLIEDQSFHFWVVDLIKMYTFWSRHEFFCSYRK